MIKHKYIWFLAVLACLFILAAHHYNRAQLHWILYVLIICVGITAWGSFDIRSNYFTKVWYRNKQLTEKKIALTFDDGPHPITHQVLDLLREYEMKATFFCIGKEIEKYPEILKRIHKEGHTVGNHTYTHSTKMGFLSARKITQEIRITNKLIAEKIHQKPQLFRPPFGVTNPNIATATEDLKMKVIGWNVRSLDTVLSKEHDILGRVLPRIKPGAIILFHDTSERTLHVLEQLLPYMKNKQFQSVTVDQLLNLQPYEN